MRSSHLGMRTKRSHLGIAHISTRARGSDLRSAPTQNAKKALHVCCKLSHSYEWPTQESTMAHLTVAEARWLAERTMEAIGHTAEEAGLIADHLIDCELRGLSYGGRHALLASRSALPNCRADASR